MRRLTVLVVALIALVACKPRPSSGARVRDGADPDGPPEGEHDDQEQTEVDVGSGERLVTIVATNDMHGGIEPQQNVGGTAFLAGAVAAIRSGLAQRFGAAAGLVVVDAGDQFQGTLLSNFTEGRTTFRALNEVGYDAVVPGNHDFDFGPVGFLDDVAPDAAAKDPAKAAAAKRGALLAATKLANFPLVSANIYERASLRTAAGATVDVQSAGCRPTAGTQTVAFANATRAPFAKPFVIRPVAGLRVAIIGLDNELTAETSMAPNVSDLCFRDASETYLELREALAAEADLFIMVVHDGNSPGGAGLRRKLEELLTAHPGAVDAVITGHSHIVEQFSVQGVPVIQSGSGGTLFGRIDLIVDAARKKVVSARSRASAGIALQHQSCPAAAAAFCAVSGGRVAYEGQPVVRSAAVDRVLKEARVGVQVLASRRLGTAPAEIKRSRTELSPLGNAVADLLRAATKTDVVFINSATLRSNLPAGAVTYEALFRVLPFSNKTITLKPVSRDHLVRLARDAVLKRGEFGILVPSGLEITFDQAKQELVSVSLSDGRVLLSNTPGAALADGPFRIGTFDFLTDKTSGVSGLNDTPVEARLDVFRELIADFLEKNPLTFTTTTDGRIKLL